MKFWFAFSLLALLATACTTQSNARLRERNAFLAGQNSVLQQQQATTAAQSPGVTLVGAVQHPQVPWITGLTLAQDAIGIALMDPDELSDSTTTAVAHMTQLAESIQALMAQQSDSVRRSSAIARCG